MNVQHKPPVAPILDLVSNQAVTERMAIPMARRLQRSHAPLSFWCQWLCLIGLFIGTFMLSAALIGTADRTFGLMTLHKLELIVALCLSLLIYPKLGIFRRLRRPVWSFLVMTCAWVSVITLSFGLLYLAGVAGTPDPVFLLWGVLVLLLQPSILIGGQIVARLIRGRSDVVLRSLVVGQGELASGLISRLEGNPFLPDQVVGTVRLDGSPVPSACPHQKPVLGEMKELAAIVEANDIERIYVALPMRETSRLAEIQTMVQDLNKDVVWVPDILSLTLLNPGVREISGYPLLSLSESPMSHFGNAFAKSFFDIVVASGMLLLLSPVMLLAAAAIKLTSPGPVFYWQYRHGWDGSVFRIYKFRSMVVHEESDGYVSQATKNDSRVTRVGRLLRRTSIDELPQLFNVLNGTMSLVGPRPHAVAHNRGYAQEIKLYMSRHRIKPGITGLAQINGLRGETETLDKMRERVNFDLAYINDWSLWRDILVLIRTPLALLSNKSVY